MNIFQIIMLCILCAFVFSVYCYPIRRDRIEQTCVKESKLKTFMDEFISNLLISLPIGIIIYLTYIIVEVFSV